MLDDRGEQRLIGQAQIAACLHLADVLHVVDCGVQRTADGIVARMGHRHPMLRDNTVWR